jgi:hypothetical protein
MLASLANRANTMTYFFAARLNIWAWKMGTVRKGCG